MADPGPASGLFAFHPQYSLGAPSFQGCLSLFRFHQTRVELLNQQGGAPLSRGKELELARKWAKEYPELASDLLRRCHFKNEEGRRGSEEEKIAPIGENQGGKSVHVTELFFDLSPLPMMSLLDRKENAPNLQKLFPAEPLLWEAAVLGASDELLQMLLDSGADLQLSMRWAVHHGGEGFRRLVMLGGDPDAWCASVDHGISKPFWIHVLSRERGGIAQLEELLRLGAQPSSASKPPEKPPTVSKEEELTRENVSRTLFSLFPADELWEALKVSGEELLERKYPSPLNHTFSASEAELLLRQGAIASSGWPLRRFGRFRKVQQEETLLLSHGARYFPDHISESEREEFLEQCFHASSLKPSFWKELPRFPFERLLPNDPELRVSEEEGKNEIPEEPFPSSSRKGVVESSKILVALASSGVMSSYPLPITLFEAALTPNFYPMGDGFQPIFDRSRRLPLKERLALVQEEIFSELRGMGLERFQKGDSLEKWSARLRELSSVEIPEDRINGRNQEVLRLFAELGKARAEVFSGSYPKHVSKWSGLSPTVSSLVLKNWIPELPVAFG